MRWDSASKGDCEMESLRAQFDRARPKPRWFWSVQNYHEDFVHCGFAGHALRSDGDQRAINVSRRCHALRYVCGICAAAIPSREMEISNWRSRDFIAGFQR